MYFDIKIYNYCHVLLNFMKSQRYFSFPHPISGETRQRFAAVVSRAVKIWVMELNPGVRAPSNSKGTSLITKRLASMSVRTNHHLKGFRGNYESPEKCLTEALRGDIRDT